MEDVAFCDLCDMDRSYREHGLGERRRAASASVSTLPLPAASLTFRSVRTRVMILTTVAGPRSIRRMHGNALETVSSCPPRAAPVRTSLPRPGARTASIMVRGSAGVLAAGEVRLASRQNRTFASPSTAHTYAGSVDQTHGRNLDRHVRAAPRRPAWERRCLP
jgi:hypothetical protein